MAEGCRIILFALCCMWIAPDNVKAEETKCQNGGVLEENSCVCDPGFTGVNCGTQLPTDEEQTELRKNLAGCLGASSVINFDFKESSGSGDGSGEGSGKEPDVASKQCGNDEKRLINGYCKFVQKFGGEIIVAVRRIPDLKNRTSPQYVQLKEEVTCLIWNLYRDLNGVVEAQILGLNEENDAVTADYVILTADDVTLADLQKTENSSLKAASDIVRLGAQISDFNECTRGSARCDPSADCENMEGSYLCICPLNHTSSAGEEERPGSKCRHFCDDEEGNDYCVNGDCSITVDQEAVCKCPTGYAGERCENHWHLFFNATFGLAIALGIALFFLVFVVVMLCFKHRISSKNSKSNFLELETNSSNEREYTVTNERREIKGISNPYLSSDEGVTVATKSLHTNFDEGITVATKEEDESDGPAIEDDRL